MRRADLNSRILRPVHAGRLAGFDPGEPFLCDPMFHFHGNPVTASEAAEIIAVRRAEWHRKRLGRARDRDAHEGALYRQLWAMIRGRDV